MKKLNLNETWKLCLQMWKWIAKERRKGNRKDVEDLKAEWLQKHGFKKVTDDCFFCEYSEKHSRKNSLPCNCPAKKADRTFSCMDSDYSYEVQPVAFYNKLVALNRKRKR